MTIIVETHQLATHWADTLAAHLGVDKGQHRGDWRQQWIAPMARILVERADSKRNDLSITDVARALDFVRTSRYWRQNLTGPVDFERALNEIIRQDRQRREASRR